MCTFELNLSIFLEVLGNLHLVFEFIGQKAVINITAVVQMTLHCTISYLKAKFSFGFALTILNFGHKELG